MNKDTEPTSVKTKENVHEGDSTTNGAEDSGIGQVEDTPRGADAGEGGPLLGPADKEVDRVDRTGYCRDGQLKSGVVRNNPGQLPDREERKQSKWPRCP